MTQPSQQDANALLMSGGVKSIGWKENPVGYTVVGTIVDEPKAQQMTKFESTELAIWPSGDPMMEIVVMLQTDLRDSANQYDDGRRQLHISPRMMPPVREAVQKVSAAGLAVGGRLAVQRTGGTGLAGSPFTFAAEYAQPALDPGGLLAGNGNDNSNQQAAAPVVERQSMLGTPAQTAPAQQGSMFTQPTPATAEAPAGVDPAKWAQLGDTQRQAVLAAMGSPAAAPPF